MLAGCGTDLFALPYDGGPDLGFTFVDLFGGDTLGSDVDLAGSDGLVQDVDLAGDDGIISLLPASCAQLGCVPTMNEGDVSLDSGTVSGCHAYNTLTISGVVQVGKSDGLGFAACADHIIV